MSPASSGTPSAKASSAPIPEAIKRATAMPEAGCPVRLRSVFSSGGEGGTKQRWQQAKRDQRELRNDEGGQRPECFFHEAIGVKPDAEHVDAEPRQAGDDIAEDG